MDAHLIDIVRFVICVLSIAIAVIAMIRADDNNLVRRTVPLLAFVPIIFNSQIGKAVYLVIVSILEAYLASMGIGFILVGGAVIMVLPIFILLHWLLPWGSRNR